MSQDFLIIIIVFCLILYLFVSVYFVDGSKLDILLIY
jgi:hypothetical protein